MNSVCNQLYSVIKSQNISQIKEAFNNLDKNTLFDADDVSIINKDLAENIRDVNKLNEVQMYFADLLKNKFNYNKSEESSELLSIDIVEEDYCDDEDITATLLILKEGISVTDLEKIIENKIKMPDVKPGEAYARLCLHLQSSKDPEFQTLLMQYIFTNYKNFELYSVVGFPEGVPNKCKSILELLNNDVKKNLKEQIAKFIANIINDDIDFSFHKLKILLQNIKDKQLIAKIYSKLHLRQFANKTLNDFKFALELWPQDLGREYSAEIQDVLRLFKKPTTDYKQKPLNQFLEECPSNCSWIILDFLDEKDLNSMANATTDFQLKNQCLNMVLKRLLKEQSNNVYYFLDENCNHGFTIEWFNTEAEIPADELKKEQFIYCYSKEAEDKLELIVYIKQGNEVRSGCFSNKDLYDIPKPKCSKIIGQNIVETIFNRILDILYKQEIIPVHSRSKSALSFVIDKNILDDEKLIDLVLSTQNLRLYCKKIFNIADLLLRLGARLPKHIAYSATISIENNVCDDLKRLYLIVRAPSIQLPNIILHSLIQYAALNGNHRTWGAYNLLESYIISHNLLFKVDSNGDTPLHFCAKILGRYYINDYTKEKYFYLYKDLFINLFSLAKSSAQFNLILEQKNNAGDSIIDIIRHTSLFFDKDLDIPDIYYENEFNYIEEKVKKISKICQDYIDHLQKAAGEIADSKRKIVEKLNKILLDAQNKVSTITDNRSKLEILKPSLSEFIKALQDEDKKELTKCRDTAWTRFFKYIMALFMSFSYGWTGSKNRLFGPERTTGYKFVKTLNDNIKAL
jgi:hypothetical protein